MVVKEEQVKMLICDIIKDIRGIVRKPIDENYEFNRNMNNPNIIQIKKKLNNDRTIVIEIIDNSDWYGDFDNYTFDYSYYENQILIGEVEKILFCDKDKDKDRYLSTREQLPINYKYMNMIKDIYNEIDKYSKEQYKIKKYQRDIILLDNFFDCIGGK